MKPMVYLIGIDHLMQYNNYIVPENLFIQFREYLSSKALELNISLMAEEFSEEALYQVYCAAEATVKSVADRLGIAHRFCDPEESDRKQLGIPHFADIKEQVECKNAIPGNDILDYKLRKKINNETIEISKTYWEKREKFWYNNISGSISDNILFVCGHEHIPGFMSLLESEGCDCKILNDFWMRDIFSDYKNLNL